MASSGGGGGAALASAGISTLSSVLSDYMETQAYKAELDARTDAAIKNVGNAVTSFELQQSKNAENIKNINNVLGDKLSERGLIAIKEESMLKAAAAETGTSGGTTDMAIKEAFINENMDKANIISSARQQQKNILTNMDTAQLGIQNQIDSILLGGEVQNNTNSFIKGLDSGLGVVSSTLGMLPDSQKAKVFGISPKGGE